MPNKALGFASCFIGISAAHLVLYFMYSTCCHALTITYVVGCYAARNNNYSGQEEAILCIDKCLKEDRKLVFQMRNEVHIFNNNVIG